MNRFNELQDNPNLKTKIIPKVNHSLEYANKIIESIDEMKNIMAEIEKFKNM